MSLRSTLKPLRVGELITISFGNLKSQILMKVENFSNSNNVNKKKYLIENIGIGFEDKSSCS